MSVYELSCCLLYGFDCEERQQSLNKLMAYFRNLEKVVSSQLFSNPNNILLHSAFRPVFLQSDKQPTVQYLHSVKALLITIQTLQQFLPKANPSYTKTIEKELEYLHSKRHQYSQTVHQYVAKAGPLTGEGIANLYYSADRLNYTADWLDRNIHHQIPKKYRFMSKDNLEDTIAGVTKHHQDSPYLQRLKDELATRPQEQPIYVTHQSNQTSKFEYVDSVQSNNPLVRALQSNTNIWKYRLYLSLWSRLSNNGKYLLHSA